MPFGSAHPRGEIVGVRGRSWAFGRQIGTTSAGSKAQLHGDIVEADLDEKAQEDARKRFLVPARHLLALGRNDSRRLSRSRRRAGCAGGRRHPSGKFRHLDRQRRPPDLGRQRLRRSGRDALHPRSGAAGDQRGAGDDAEPAFAQGDLHEYPGRLRARHRGAGSLRARPSTHVAAQRASWWARRSARCSGRRSRTSITTMLAKKNPEQPAGALAQAVRRRAAG